MKQESTYTADDKKLVYELWCERLAETAGIIDAGPNRLYTLGFVARKCDIDEKRIRKDFHRLYSLYSNLPYDSAPLLEDCVKRITKGYNKAEDHTLSYRQLCEKAYVYPYSVNDSILKEAFPEISDNKRVN